jgi:CHASE3 domain sensor protein
LAVFHVRRLAPLSNTASVALAVLLTLAVPAVGMFQAAHVLAHGLRLERNVRDAEFLASRGLRLAIDEETAVRGYASTSDPTFLQPYYEAAPAFPLVREQLRHDLRDLGLSSALDLVEDARRTREQWVRTVAKPVIGGSRADLTLQLRGKGLVDHVRDDMAAVEKLIADRAQSIDVETTTQLGTIVRLTGFAAVLIAGIIVVGAVVQHRLWGVLAHRRLVVEALQRSFGHEAHRLPETDVGTVYVSATPHSAFGGDVFDVRCLDASTAYVLVADVSGKGIAATADATFVKHAVETLVREHGEPGDVLHRLNTLYAQRETAPESFVVAFLGVLDYRHGTLTYSSAAHGSAYLRRAGRASVEQLTVTGPLIGLAADSRFHSTTLLLHPGDTIVLATDGLTEARDRRGDLLTDAGAMRWIHLSNATSAQQLVDELVRRRRDFAGRHTGDDMAIVALTVNRPRNEASEVENAIGAT